jgi:uncharacterized membrane protein YwzB
MMLHFMENRFYDFFYPDLFRFILQQIHKGTIVKNNEASQLTVFNILTQNVVVPFLSAFLLYIESSSQLTEIAGWNALNRLLQPLGELIN